VLSPVVPEAFNIAAFLLERHLSEAREKIPVVCCEYQPLTYIELTETIHLARNGLLGLGMELETKPTICRTRPVAT
jgi:hypothetical protein